MTSEHPAMLMVAKLREFKATAESIVAKLKNIQ